MNAKDGPWITTLDGKVRHIDTYENGQPGDVECSFDENGSLYQVEDNNSCMRYRLGPNLEMS